MAPVVWEAAEALVGYDVAEAAMEQRVAAIARGQASECVWLVEHPPLYTAGTSARTCDLLDPERFPVFRSGRGGQYTYHGPGQRVAYVMVDVRARKRDVRAFVHALEDWVICALARLGVQGKTRPDRIGVWVVRQTPSGLREDKIAAIGVRLRRWISFHGISLNVAPNLEHFSGIVPCGIAQHGVTSLSDLGVKASMADVDDALRAEFDRVFGPTQAADQPLLDSSS